MNSHLLFTICGYLAVVLGMLLICCIDSLFDFFAMKMGAGWVLIVVLLAIGWAMWWDYKRFEKKQWDNYNNRKDLNA